MKIKVNFKKFEKENLCGFADVIIRSDDVGEIKLNSFRVMCEPGKQPWVGFPATAKKTKDNKVFYNEEVELSPDLREEVCMSIISEYRRSKDEDVPL